MEIKVIKKIARVLEPDYRYVRCMPNQIRFRDRYGFYKMEALTLGDGSYAVSGCYYVSPNGKKLKFAGGKEAKKTDELVKAPFDERKNVLAESALGLVKNNFDYFVLDLWKILESFGFKNDAALRIESFWLVLKTAFEAKKDRLRYVKVSLCDFNDQNGKFVYFDSNIFGLKYLIKSQVS